MYKRVHILFVFLFFSFCSFSQSQNRVFLIGENEEAYENLVSECQTMLLTVADQKMDRAYDLWKDMLVSLENFSDSQNFDLKGVKLWMNVFWYPDGHISKIAYYPKPTSKNMDFDQVTQLLNIFIDQYQLPISSDRCFSHYGSASFPTHYSLPVHHEK